MTNVQNYSSEIPQERKHARILVVDDEDALCHLLRISLEKIGHTVVTATNGREALERLAEDSIDLVLLDIIMPGMDGFEVCRVLREQSDVPIVMLTALNRSDDVVRGFGLGADDYITKPFSFREVQVRIEAILRRVYWQDRSVVPSRPETGDIVLNTDAHEAQVRGRTVQLTPIEYRLLRYMMGMPNRAVSKSELFRQVWGYDMVGSTNLVEVAVRRLREKIEEDPSNPVYLVTVHGVGYKFHPKPETTSNPA